MMGPPVSQSGFLRKSAWRPASFMCLCGCGHRLDECPCNDQPIGAVTMLSYLQKVLRENHGSRGAVGGDGGSLRGAGTGGARART